MNKNKSTNSEKTINASGVNNNKSKNSVRKIVNKNNNSSKKTNYKLSMECLVKVPNKNLSKKKVSNNNSSKKMPNNNSSKNMPKKTVNANNNSSKNMSKKTTNASGVNTSKALPKKTTNANNNSSKKMINGGGIFDFLNNPIPQMSTKPINSAQNATKKGVNAVNNWIKDLKINYQKSVTKASNVKIGDQRLVQGGSKKKSSKKKLKGGDGSDFASTFNSRGPSNAPDTYWNVDGEKFFRQFNKTGEYIPNSQLAKAATPKFLSGPKINKVVGYNSFETDFASIVGGKNKSKINRKTKCCSKK